MVFNSPRPPLTVGTSGAEGNVLSTDSYLQDISEFSQLPAGWDGCMKYKCNDEENCIGTPTGVPCCEELLHRMAVDIDRIMIAWNAISFPFSGTLLGIIREGSVMPNNVTADIDFLVDSEIFQNIYTNPQMGPIMRYVFHTLGYHLFPDGSDLGRVCFRKNSNLGLQDDTAAVNYSHGVDNWMYFNYYKYGDLYRTEKRSDTGTFFIFGSTNFPSGLKFDDIYPLRSVKIKDYEFKIPLRAEEMLTVMYGNWTEVKKSPHH